MPGSIEREGPFDPTDGGRRGASTVGMAATLRRLRSAGASGAILLEAETRMTANLERGRAWAWSWVQRQADRGDGGTCCDCGDELVPGDWRGEATVRCGVCGARWHVTRTGTSVYSSSRRTALTEPDEDWLARERPLPDRRSVLAEEGVPDDQDARLAAYLRPDPRLEPVLAPVLADLLATCPVQPHIESWIEQEDGYAQVMLLGHVGGSGVKARLDAPLAQQIVEVADQVQEWAVEDLWAADLPATWPHCPHHPDSHPLEPVVVEGEPVWRCPGDGTTISLIGHLGS